MHFPFFIISIKRDIVIKYCYINKKRYCYENKTLMKLKFCIFQKVIFIY